MKNILLVFVLLFTLFVVKAQKKQNVYFFKEGGKEVFEKDSADFIRVILEPDSGENNFILQEFYANGKRKTLGSVSTFEPFLVYEGLLMKYNKLGKRIYQVAYEKGKPKGMAYYFYSNGKIEKQIEYLLTPNTIKNIDAFRIENEITSVLPGDDTKLIYLADSLGVVSVKDGNGYVKYISDFNKKVIIDEGNYKDGVKHGIWKGSQTDPDISYVESYDMGKFISGESTKENQKYSYNSMMLNPPQYKGGMKNFYQFIGSSLRYPTDARNDKVSGSVLMEYTVDRDGYVVEVSVKKSVHPSLDREAIRVLKSSIKWTPATLRGIPVRVRYAIPIKFSLNY